MDLRKLINDYLKNTRVLQLATSVNNQPWACTVHFYSDNNLNFYWCSITTRRHSLEIAQNSKIAVTVKIHEDTPDEKYVIGISAEGTAQLIDDDEIKKIGNLYVKKLDKEPTLIADILSSKKPFKFYRFTPTRFALFDTKNFPDDPRQELKF